MCPGGVLPAGLVGAGDCLAVPEVAVADGDDPADGAGLAVCDGVVPAPAAPVAPAATGSCAPAEP